MNRKLYWGLAALIIGLIGAGGFVLYRQWTEIQQLKREADFADKLPEKSNESKETPEVVDERDIEPPHSDYHVHEDGTPHIGKHDAPKVQNTPPEGLCSHLISPK